MRYGEACLCIVIGICVLAGGCRNETAEQIDDGRFEGPVYHNDYLGLEITIPTDWTLQDRQTAQQMVRTGGRLIAGGNENMRAAMEASESRTIHLFTAFQHPYGSPVPYNPSFYAVAENISHAPGIRTGGDYLFHARRLLQSGQMTFSFPREIYTETRAGVEFHVMEAELNVPPATVRQEYFAAIRRGYVLLMILSFSTDEERAVLRDILATLQFAEPPQASLN